MRSGRRVEHRVRGRGGVPRARPGERHTHAPSGSRTTAPQPGSARAGWGLRARQEMRPAAAVGAGPGGGEGGAGRWVGGAWWRARLGSCSAALRCSPERPLRPSRTTVGREKSLRRKAAVFVAWVGWRGTVLTCCSGRKLESESTFMARPRAGGLRLPAL